MATVAEEASEEFATADQLKAADSSASPAALTGEDPPTRGGALSAFQSRPFTLFWSTIVLSLTGVCVSG